MKNTKKSAFTIVELVIVIAVIAILSAVLIPTFGSIIKDANKAADQVTASTLTSELHVYLMGNTIDSEAELMDALEKSGIGEKLVPKSAAQGGHFWYDMNNQKFIVATADDVEDMEVNVQNASVENEGAVLVNATLINASDETANISFRDIYGKNVYLVDATSEIGDILNAIDNLSESNKDTYKTEIVDALANFNILSVEKAYADEIYTKLQKTLIITTSGTFYHQGVTEAYVYFANGGLGSHSNKFVLEGESVVKYAYSAESYLPSVNGTIVIPDSAVCIGDDSLQFEGEEKIKVDASKLTTVFCTNATNAVINDAYTIVGSELKMGDEVIATLSSSADRAPFVDFGFVQTTSERGDYYWVGNAFNNPTLYLYAPSYIGGENLLQVSVQNNDGTLFDGQITWTTSNDNALSISDVNTGEKDEDDNDIILKNVVNFKSEIREETEIVVTATIKAQSGEDVSKSFTIKLCSPSAANIVTNVDIATFALPSESGYEIDWQYISDSNNRRIFFEFAENNPYFYTENNAVGLAVIANTPKIEIRSDDENPIFDIEDGFIVLSDGFTGEKTTQTFTVTVDGYLATTFTVNVTTPFAYSNFHYVNSVERPYYLASGGSNIADSADVIFKDLFTLGNEVEFDHVKVSLYIYTESGSKFAYHKDSEFKEKLTDVKINNVSYTEPVYIAKDAFGSTSIDTTGVSEYTYTETVNGVEQTKTGKIMLLIQLEPVNANEDGSYSVVDADSTASYKFEVVDGKNLRPVYTNDALDNATVAGNLNSLVNDDAVTNVVMLTDVELVDADGNPLDGEYQLNIVEGETLYGNGFVVNAEKYTAAVAESVTVTVEGSPASYYCTVCNKSIPDLDTALASADQGKIRHWYVEGEEYTYSATMFGQTYTYTRTDGHRVKTDGEDTVVYTPATEASSTTYDCYENNGVFISLNGGTIDNIYVDGPIYPELEYTGTACELKQHNSDGDGNSETPYHVSGIQAIGDATISNSYVSGFRQPVKTAAAEDGTAGTLTITNSTLRGGNYANLQVTAGDLNLKNVTTIQDQNGIKNTFGAKNNDGTDLYVTGLGLVVEDTAFGTNVLIEGYFDQYNWIEKNQTATLPTMSEDEWPDKLDMNNIFECLFGYVNYKGIIETDLRLYRFMPFIHQAPDQAVIETTVPADASIKEYIHTGIIFIDTEKVEGEGVHGELETGFINITYGDGFDGTEKYTGEKHDSVALQLSRTAAVTADIALGLVLTGGYDTTAVFYSFMDGREWEFADDNESKFVSNMEEADTFVKVTSEDLTYNGYYANYNN